MRHFFSTLYGKISAVFLVLILGLGLVQIWFSVQASMNFVRETDQQLNRHLARDLANEFRPFLEDSLDSAGIEHTIHTLMVMNPRVEIYLLDDHGKVLAFFADPRKKIKLDYVDLEPVYHFLSNADNMPLLGDDPRQVHRQKPFSAAPIKIGGEVDGYLYVILGGEQYDTASEMIKDSYIFRTTAVSLLLALGFTGIVGLIAFAFLTRRFRKMIESVKKFAQGNYQHRIEVRSQDEIGQLATAFNQMADTIVDNMETLRRNDQLRRELVANVSHDLRSPLASIQGYLETILMKEGGLSTSERRNYLQTILDNTIMLNRLVGELFELSKYDAKQIEPKPEPFSLAELTQDVVMKFMPAAREHKIDLRADLPRNLPMVRADIGMIERALSNLIENALCYTTAGGTVQVSLAQTQERVGVKVSDTGCGIPKDELPRVFDRFYRVEKSRGRNSGGTGLGLAIAKKILDLHDNTITVDSVLDKGTTFSFELNVDRRH